MGKSQKPAEKPAAKPAVEKPAVEPREGDIELVILSAEDNGVPVDLSK